MQLAIKIKADLQDAIRGVNQFAGAMNGVDHSVSRARHGVESISRQLAQLRNYAITAAGISGLGGMIEMVDQYGQMASRLKMVTESAAEYEMVQSRLLATASETYRPLSEAQEMYLRTADALKSMGYNTRQALDVSDSLSFLMVTNAASGERAASAIQAFSKSLQTGEVHALEWRTILTAIPTVVDKIAAATGKTREEIRKMGAEGKLALTDLTEGLRMSLPENRQDAAGMPATVADAFTRLRTNLQTYLGQANEGIVSTGTLVKAINLLSENLGALDSAFAGVAAVMISRWVGAMQQAQVAAARESAANTAGIAANAARAESELLVSQRLAQRTIAEHAMAASSQALARTDVAAAQAALSRAQMIDSVGAREKVVAWRTQELTAATNALSAANARATATGNARSAALGAQAAATLAARNATATAAAATAASGAIGALTRAGSGLVAMLGGPWGIALGVAISALFLFRDSAGEVKSVLADLSDNLDEARKQFSGMSFAQQAAEISALKGKIASLREEYDDKVTDIGKTARSALTGWFSDIGPETRAALEEVTRAVEETKTGAVPDWGEIARAVEGATDMHEKLRAELLKLIGEVDTFRLKGRGVTDVLREVGGEAGKAADKVTALAVALRDSPGATSMAKRLARQLEDLQDPSAEGKARRDIRDAKANNETYTPELEAQIIATAIAVERLNKARQAGRKKDPLSEANLSRTRDLIHQLTEANQQLEQAQAGVFESTTRSRDALDPPLRPAIPVSLSAGCERDVERRGGDAFLGYRPFHGLQGRAGEPAAPFQRRAMAAASRLPLEQSMGSGNHDTTPRYRRPVPTVAHRTLRGRYRHLRPAGRRRLHQRLRQHGRKHPHRRRQDLGRHAGRGAHGLYRLLRPEDGLNVHNRASQLPR
jgi:tape measure domain-containing protein